MATAIDEAQQGLLKLSKLRSYEGLSVNVAENGKQLKKIIAQSKLK